MIVSLKIQTFSHKNSKLIQHVPEKVQLDKWLSKKRTVISIENITFCSGRGEGVEEVMEKLDGKLEK